MTIDNNDVNQFAAVEQTNATESYLTRELLVRTKQELLTSLATCIERAADLCTTEGTVVQKATVFTGEWNTLSHHLVDDVNTVLSKTMHVCFTCAEVATLDGVIEQAMNAVAVTLVVLCTIDSALSSNGVRTTCGVMEREGIDLVTKFRHCCCGRCSSKASTDNDDFELALVVGVHQLHVLFV